MFALVTTLVALRWTAVTAQGCTMCQDGSSPVGQIGSQDCAAFAADALAFVAPDSDTCVELQARAFQFCDCPTLPEGGCSLCANDFFEIERPNRVLPGWDLTCGDILFANDAEECTRNAVAEYYCGCPNASESSACTLCPSDVATARAVSIELLFGSRRVPPTFENSCLDMQDAATLYGLDTCSELTSPYPVDLASYCGCPASQPPTEIECNLCTDVGELLFDVELPSGQTCGDMAVVANYVTFPTYCKAIVDDLRPTCCGSREIVDPPTDPPLADRSIETAPPTTSAGATVPTVVTAVLFVVLPYLVS